MASPLACAFSGAVLVFESRALASLSGRRISRSAPQGFLTERGSRYPAAPMAIVQLG
jgi:hypothetical protein